MPAVPVYATILTLLKSSTANRGILSRMVLKSRASILPERIRCFIVDRSVVVNAVYKPPAVTAIVLGASSCFTTMVCQANPDAETVIFAVRDMFNGLACKFNISVLLPFPEPGLTASHDWSELAVHATLAVIPTVVFPEIPPMFTLYVSSKNPEVGSTIFVKLFQ